MMPPFAGDDRFCPALSPQTARPFFFHASPPVRSLRFLKQRRRKDYSHRARSTIFSEIFKFFFCDQFSSFALGLFILVAPFDVGIVILVSLRGNKDLSFSLPFFHTTRRPLSHRLVTSKVGNLPSTHPAPPCDLPDPFFSMAALSRAHLTS